MPSGGRSPQLRLLALIECGTRALIDAAFDGHARAGEHVLARRLLHALEPGMLLLADRNFPGYDLWGLAAATGADLAWRAKKNQVFTPLQILPDGSFISVMPTPKRACGTAVPVPATCCCPARRPGSGSGSSSTPSLSPRGRHPPDGGIPPGHHAARPPGSGVDSVS